MAVRELSVSDYFLDTSVLIAYFKKEDQQTHDLITQVLDRQASATISAITVAEIWSASDMVDDIIREERQSVLELLDVRAIDNTIAQYAGKLRRQHNLALPDALIAACAVEAGGRFYSKDPHFSRLLKSGVLTGQVYSALAADS